VQLLNLYRPGGPKAGRWGPRRSGVNFRTPWRGTTGYIAMWMPGRGKRLTGTAHHDYTLPINKMRRPLDAWGAGRRCSSHSSHWISDTFRQPEM